MKDSGKSKFDQYRSPQAVPVNPDGGRFTRLCETPTDQERKMGFHRMMRGTSYGEQMLFDKHESNGGSTYDFRED